MDGANLDLDMDVAAEIGDLHVHHGTPGAAVAVTAAQCKVS
jgi:hypothetical protein